MGTGFYIELVPPEGHHVAAELGGVVDAELERINALMSTYLPDSEISRFNRAAVHSPFTVSEDFCYLTRLSRDIHASTEGAFNPAVGPLVELWGFGAAHDEGQIPAAEEISGLVKTLDFAALDIQCTSDGAGEISKHAALALDFSAIAKGYAADRIAALLAGRGYRNYLVEIGGELVVAGVNRTGLPWRIAVEKPALMQGGIQRILAVTGGGVATSGDYRNYFEQDGVRYSHTIDPRSGWPVRHNLASVTVIADSAAKADALATAIMVLGAEQGQAYAERQKLAAYFLVQQDTGFEEKYTSAMEPYLAASQPGGQ